MADKISTLVLTVDLDCKKCCKKIIHALCKFPEIEQLTLDEKQKKVIITGRFNPECLIKVLYCKLGCKIIKGYEIPKSVKPETDGGKGKGGKGKAAADGGKGKGGKGKADADGGKGKADEDKTDKDKTGDAKKQPVYVGPVYVAQICICRACPCRERGGCSPCHEGPPCSGICRSCSPCGEGPPCGEICKNCSPCSEGCPCGGIRGSCSPCSEGRPIYTKGGGQYGNIDRFCSEEDSACKTM